MLLVIRVAFFDLWPAPSNYSFTALRYCINIHYIARYSVNSWQLFSRYSDRYSRSTVFCLDVSDFWSLIFG